MIFIYNHYDNLENFGVLDINFKKNALELMNIFNKKFFWDSMNNIKLILKLEREKKAEILENANFITIGPFKIIEILAEFLDLNKHFKNKIILEKLIENRKFILIQYLLGIYSTIRVNKKIN